METVDSTQRNHPFSGDLPLRSSGGNTSVEVPRHHHPTRLVDIAEEVELRIQVDKSDDPRPVSTYRKAEKAEFQVDETTHRNVRESERDYSAFFKAIEEGDVDSVATQMSDGADIEQLSEDGLSPLAIAIANEQVRIVELLLEGHVNIHRRSRTLPFLVHALMKPKHGCLLMQQLLYSGATLNTISGPDQKNALHWAASEGMTEAVDFLLTKGMDIEAKCYGGRNPLMLAAEAGYEDVVKVLWAQGADLEATGESGATALTRAAWQGKVAALKFLLEKGASIEHEDNNGHRPLAMACHFGHEEVVKALLDAGADINARGAKPEGWTPIMVAASMNRVGIVRTLIARGADLELRSAYEEDALGVALRESREGAAKAILEVLTGPGYQTDSVALQLAMANGHATIKALMTTASIMYSYMEYGHRNEHAWLGWVLKQGGDKLKQVAMRKMLHVAMEDHDLPMIQALLDQGCDVDVHLESGHTTLSFAVGRRDLDLIKILLKAGANPNKPIPDPDSHAYTPFDRAIISLKDGLDLEVVDLLLETGRCSINSGRDPESTAFSFVLGKASEWASGVADTLAIRMIDSIPDVEKDRDQIGCSLLHVAIHHQRKDIVDLLLSKGMSIDVVADAGYTPFIQACQYSPKMVPFLVELGANIHTKYKSNAGALHAAAVEGNLETLTYLIDLGMKLEEYTAKGYTPLACALTWEQEAAALELLKRGASIKWTTRERKLTALHFAARNGMEKMVTHLVKMGAGVNVLDAKGWSPLHEACATGTTTTVTALLDAGADIECALSNGDRPLHVAMINENEKVALLLMERGADIYAFASRNRSPLHIAADYSLFRAAEELLSRGLTTQIEHVDESTWTPLCCCGHVDIVELLIEHGANVHYADKDGWTPLHQAVHNGERDVALALVEAGARLNDCTLDDGLMVLERALDLEEWGRRAKGVAGVDARSLKKAARRRKHELFLEREREYRLRKEAEAEEWRRVEQEERKSEEERLEQERKRSEEEALEGLDGKFELVDAES